MTVLFRARGDHESEETPTNETAIYVETFCYEMVLSMECDILNVNFTNCIDFHVQNLLFSFTSRPSFYWAPLATCW